MKPGKTVWFLLVFLASIVALDVDTGLAGSGNGIKLPITGQTNCYDSSGNVISCMNTGQDGELQNGAPWPDPRFIINTDTSVTDNLTRLVWAPNGNLLPSRDPQWEKRSTVFEGALTWQNALDYVAKLNAEKYLGHNDWRMPNFTELNSLVNRAQPNTAMWLNTQGFTDVQAGDFYWSSTSNINDPSRAWVVDMTFGNVNYFRKNNSHFLWPVRGGK